MAELSAPRSRGAEDCSLDVVGIGQNSVDHLYQVESYPEAGAKVEALASHILPGGQVATAILAARLQGLRCCYIGAIGDDPLGGDACEVLRREGIRLELKKVQGACTQSALILVDRTGERTIVECYDPRVVVTPEDLDRACITSARVLHLDVTDIPAAIQAARWARDAGTLVSLDCDRVLPGIEELLGLVDLLVVSEDLPAKLGLPAQQDLSAQVRCPDPGLGLATLRKLCPGFLCITRGERGSVALCGDVVLTGPAFEVDEVDTTGCGDVFRGAMIYGVLQAWEMKRVLRYATAAAAVQARSLGAQGGVPDRQVVLDFLAENPGERPQQ